MKVTLEYPGDWEFAEPLQVEAFDLSYLGHGRVMLNFRCTATIPRPAHPEPGQLGWFTRQGDPIEILGWDEDTQSVWVRFPKGSYRHGAGSGKTYVYDRDRWNRYWTWDPSKINVVGATVNYEDDDDE